MGGEDLLGRHGNPLQYSCLENLMDRGAWWITVLGVARVQTDLGRKPPPRPSPDSLQRGFPITWSFSSLASFLFLTFPAFQHRAERGALVPNCSPGGPALPSLDSASSAQFLFHSHPTCLSGSPSPQLWSPCQYIFLLRLFSLPKALLLHPCGIPACWVTHGTLPSTLTTLLCLQFFFWGFLLRGASLSCRVLLIFGQSLSKVKRVECWFPHPTQLRTSGYLSWLRGWGFLFSKVVFGKIFGNIYFVPLACCESSSYLLSEFPVFSFWKRGYPFKRETWFCFGVMHYFFNIYLRLS